MENARLNEMFREDRHRVGLPHTSIEQHSPSRRSLVFSALPVVGLAAVAGLVFYSLPSTRYDRGGNRIVDLARDPVIAHVDPCVVGSVHVVSNGQDIACPEGSAQFNLQHAQLGEP